MGNIIMQESDLDCCHCESPFIFEKRRCCDGDDDCHFFDEEARDCFWPQFTHPSWLCCKILYGCKSDDNCDDHDDDDDRHGCGRR